MPRPGSPQQPQFQRGSSLAYGEATAANELGAMSETSAAPMISDDQEFAPQTPEDMFLYSPSDKPDEPITAGAPFGAGPNTRPRETSKQFIRRVTSVIQTTSSVPAEVKAFLDRAAAGE